MRLRLPGLFLLPALAIGAFAAPALSSGTLVFDCEFPAETTAGGADSVQAAEQVRFLLDSGRRKAYRETGRGNEEVAYRVEAADTAVAFLEGGMVTRVDASWSSTRRSGDRVRKGFCRVR